MDSNNQSQGQNRSRQQGNSQSRRNEQAKQRPQKQTAPKLKPLPEMGAAPEAKKASKQESAVISDVVTQGKNGEQNITVEWYWEQIGNDMPCGWIIGTLADNQLEATVKQLSYSKGYSGSSKLKTGLVPVAPEGTTGTLEITDTTTGEKREIKFRWYAYGLFGMLWRLIKKLFTNKGD